MSPAPGFGPNSEGVQIEVDGADLADADLTKLADLRVSRGLGSIGRAVLTFTEDHLAFDKSVGAKFTFDKKVKIKVVDFSSQSTTELISGTVVAREAEFDERGTTVRVTVHDATAKLAASTEVLSQYKATAHDVLTKLVQSVGLKLNAPTGQKSEWSLYAKSPLGIVEEIAKNLGWDWCVDNQTLNLWPASDGNAPGNVEFKAELGGEITKFAIRDSISDVRKAQVDAWDHSRMQAIKATASPKSSRSTAAFTSGKPTAPGLVKYANAPVLAGEEAADWAGARAGTGGRVVARGSGRLSPKIVPGGTLRVINAGDLSGKFYIREVEHRYSRGSWSTDFVSGDRDAPKITNPWPVADSVGSGRFDRLTVGIVTEVGNGTNDKPRGAVRVKFPALDNGTVSSEWASVVHLGAGAGRGLNILPEVNDQVVVGFADGDLRRPLIIGGVYSANAAAVAADMGVDANGSSTAHTLVTRNGDRFELSSGDGPKTHHVKLALKDGKHVLRLGEDASEFTVPDGVPLTLKSGTALIKIDGNGEVSIEASTIVMKAKTKLEISAAEVKIAAQSKLELSSSGQAMLKASMTSVESSGPTAIKGAVVNIN